MSMCKTTLAPGELSRSVHMEKVTSARQVNRPLKVVPGQRKTDVNSYRGQTVHRGKVDPGVIELPGDHVNRPPELKLN